MCAEIVCMKIDQIEIEKIIVFYIHRIQIKKINLDHETQVQIHSLPLNLKKNNLNIIVKIANEMIIVVAD